MLTDEFNDSMYLSYFISFSHTNCYKNSYKNEHVNNQTAKEVYLLTHTHKQHSGKIITIETVSLRLPKRQWSSLDIKPDQTSFPDEFLRHTLYITRIYFCYGPPEVELIGGLRLLLLGEGGGSVMGKKVITSS